MTTRRTVDYGPQYEACATPESIEVALRKERAKLRTQERLVARLEALLEKRTEEKSTGFWPGPRKDPLMTNPAQTPDVDEHWTEPDPDELAALRAAAAAAPRQGPEPIAQDDLPEIRARLAAICSGN